MIDFDESSPPDTGVIADYPANERAERQKVIDWTEADHYEVDGKHRAARFKDQASDPTLAAGEIAVYGKTAGGKTNLFIKDEDANVIQLTEDGAINLASLLVATLTVSGASNLQGLLTLDAHLKTSLATLEFLGSGDEVGMRYTRSAADNFLLEILRSGSLRRAITADANDENDADALVGKRFGAAGKGTFWDTGVDMVATVGSSLTLNGLAATASYARLPFWQVCVGEVTFSQANVPSSNPHEHIEVDYPRAFSARPNLVFFTHGSVGDGNNAQGRMGIYSDRAVGVPTATARMHLNPDSAGNEHLEGFDYIAIGPE